jgi:hypothetical protein
MGRFPVERAKKQKSRLASRAACCALAVMTRRVEINCMK